MTSEAARLSRATLQAQAKSLALPAISASSHLASLVRVATAHPRTWTPEDFALIAPHLALHQDLRAGSAERADAILRAGLPGGQVDSVGNLMNGRWTWCRGRLSGTDTYLFIYGALRYRGRENPYLAPGNVPLCHFRPAAGTGAAELLEQIVATARSPADVPGADPEDADSASGDVPSQPRA